MKRESYVKGLVTRFEAAVRKHEMVGARPPEARASIERKYIDARERLIDCIEGLHGGKR